MSILHYPGDIDADSTQTLGPDMFDGFWAIKSGEFDGERTTMELRPIPPKELTERAQARLKEAMQLERIMTLFGAP